MATLSQQIGGIVRHHRKRHAWTQAELAAKAELSVEMINRVEGGRVVPSLRTLEVLAGLFNIPVRDLFGIGDHAAEAGRDDAMVRLVGRVSSLDNDDLEWVDRLVAVALNRKVRPTTTSLG